MLYQLETVSRLHIHDFQHPLFVFCIFFICLPFTPFVPDPSYVTVMKIGFIYFFTFHYPDDHGESFPFLRRLIGRHLLFITVPITSNPI